MTIELDAGTAAGIALIISTIGGWAIKIIAEIRRDGKTNQDKLDDIKTTTEEAAKNVNGNLTEVRNELAQQRAENKALHQTVTALSSVLSASKTAEAITSQRRSTDPINTQAASNAEPTKPDTHESGS